MSEHSLTILGSTGSIGTQALDVVRAHPERLSVVALTAGRNVDLLVQQAREFAPKAVAVLDEADAATAQRASARPAHSQPAPARLR